MTDKHLLWQFSLPEQSRGFGSFCAVYLIPGQLSEAAGRMLLSQQVSEPQLLEGNSFHQFKCLTENQEMKPSGNVSGPGSNGGSGLPV